MSRQLNKTLEQCKAIKLQLDLGLSVFLAGKEKYPQKHINILTSLGIEVTAEAQYTQPDNVLIGEIDRFGGLVYYIPEKVLTGYIIKKK